MVEWDMAISVWGEGGGIGGDGVCVHGGDGCVWGERYG